MPRAELLAASLLFAASCAPRPVQPDEMSAAQHELTAAYEESAATEHLAKVDPNVDARLDCTKHRNDDEVCWTGVRNPSTIELDAAREHRQHAAAHRAASQALRDAEKRACEGLSEIDRDMSPFSHEADIAAVAPLRSPPHWHVEGAVIRFHDVPGLSADRLRRIVACHVARSAALGYEVPEMPYCPLVPRGAVASVSETSAGLVVTIRAADDASAQEIWRRAQTLRGSDRP